MFGTPWKSYFMVSVSIVPMNKMNRMDDLNISNSIHIYKIHTYMGWPFYNERYINEGIKIECYIKCYVLVWCIVSGTWFCCLQNDTCTVYP